MVGELWTEKENLLEKQKKGKARAKQFGKIVEIPQEAQAPLLESSQKLINIKSYKKNAKKLFIISNESIFENEGNFIFCDLILT